MIKDGYKKTSIGYIPLDWEVKKFKDITDILRCGLASTPKYVEDGVPFLSAQNVKNGKLNLDKYKCISNELHEKLTKNTKPQKNDILMTRVGNVGDAAIVDIDWEFSVYVSLTHIRMKEGYDSQFFTQLLNSSFIKRRSLQTQYKGGGVANLNVKVVEEFDMPIPPLKEQQKIVEILSSVDAAIKKTEQVIAKTEEVKKGLMQQLLTRGIDQKKFKDSPVGQIPIIWNVERLGSEAYIKARIGWKGLSSEEYTDEGPYLIAGKHILRTNILWEKCDHISMERYEESPEIMLRNDDVIMTKDGTIGRVAHIESLNDKATINGTMMLIRPLENLEGKFIYYYFQSTRFQRLIKEKVSGSSIPHIFQRDLVEFKIPVPPLNEQRKIVEILSNIDKKIEREYEVLEYISNLKKGLMQQLLTGQIRVKVD